MTRMRKPLRLGDALRMSSVAAVLRQSQGLDGALIRVQGILRIEFECRELVDACPPGEAGASGWLDGLWLESPRKGPRLDWNLDGAQVEVVGVLALAQGFPPLGCGHMGGWKAELSLHRLHLL